MNCYSDRNLYFILSQVGETESLYISLIASAARHSSSRDHACRTIAGDVIKSDAFGLLQQCAVRLARLQSVQSAAARLVFKSGITSAITLIT
jgi:hypothetical protein